MNRPAPMLHCLEELKLTDAQSAKIEDLQERFRKQQNTLNADIENLRIDINSKIKKEDFKGIKTLTKQLSDKELALKDAHIDFIQNVMKELNKEQKTLFKERMGSIGGMMGRHHGLMGWQNGGPQHPGRSLQNNPRQQNFRRMAPKTTDSE